MNSRGDPVGQNRISLPVSNFKASSSIGRAAVSKTAGWGFDSLLACQLGNACGTMVAAIGPWRNDRERVTCRPGNH